MWWLLKKRNSFRQPRSSTCQKSNSHSTWRNGIPYKCPLCNPCLRIWNHTELLSIICRHLVARRSNWWNHLSRWALTALWTDFGVRDKLRKNTLSRCHFDPTNRIQLVASSPRLRRYPWLPHIQDLGTYLVSGARIFLKSKSLTENNSILSPEPTKSSTCDTRTFFFCKVSFPKWCSEDYRLLGVQVWDLFPPRTGQQVDLWDHRWWSWTLFGRNQSRRLQTWTRFYWEIGSPRFPDFEAHVVCNRQSSYPSLPSGLFLPCFRNTRLFP